MIRSADRNIQMIIQVARRLGELREKVVFLGICCPIAPVRHDCQKS